MDVGHVLLAVAAVMGILVALPMVAAISLLALEARRGTLLPEDRRLFETADPPGPVREHADTLRHDSEAAGRGQPARTEN